MANVALSSVTKFEGISTADNGNYVQYPDLQDFVSAVRSIGTLEKNAIDALAKYDELAADADGKVIVLTKGAEAEVQFTPSAALRASLVAVRDALTTAKTAVGSVQIALP
jgi:hypothetical protein